MESTNPHRIEWVALFFCLALLFFLVRLILQRRLREEYILIWLGVFCCLVLLSVFRSGLDQVANFLGIYYAPSLLFLIITAGIVAYTLHLSVVVSGQEHKIKELAQKIALLEKSLKEP
jgi:hypothetical protein